MTSTLLANTVCEPRGVDQFFGWGAGGGGGGGKSKEIYISNKFGALCAQSHNINFARKIENFDV